MISLTAANGIQESADASGTEWQIYALAFVHEYLTGHATLFVDDLWADGLAEPISPRALGAVMLYAARKGWLSHQETLSGDIIARPSVRSNGQLKAVWKSNLYEK